MDIVSAITELNELGYSLAFNGDSITYDFVNDRELNTKRAAELLKVIRSNTSEVIRCLSKDNFYSFVPIVPEDEPFAVTTPKRTNDDEDKLTERIVLSVAVTTPKEDEPFTAAPTEENAPPQTVIVKRGIFLNALYDIMKSRGADTRIIQEFEKRLSEPKRCGVEYPVMLRYNGGVYMLTELDKIMSYARSGNVRFRMYRMFDCMTMIFHPEKTEKILINSDT